MTSFLKVITNKLMDKNELAAMCKAFRVMKDLTQGDVAEMVSVERGKTIRKQSISVAENPEKGGVDALRIEIIELLSGRKLSGPYWKFEPEQEEVSEEVG